MKKLLLIPLIMVAIVGLVSSGCAEPAPAPEPTQPPTEPPAAEPAPTEPAPTEPPAEEPAATEKPPAMPGFSFEYLVGTIPFLYFMVPGKGVEALVQLSWDGEIEWSSGALLEPEDCATAARQHHDWQREGNPVGYYAPGQDFVEHGDTLILAAAILDCPEICADAPLVDDIIYEVDWEGNPTGFEWHARHHLYEFGFDESARDFILHPKAYEKPVGAWPHFDWVHANTVSVLGENKWYSEDGDERFHPDNIMFNFRQAGILGIISRETGEVVWRVGPDYDEGTPEHGLGPIIGAHQAHMIPQGLPGEGNVLVFDNGGASGYGGDIGYPRYTRKYSRVLEFNPVTLEIVWEYTAEDFYSAVISGAQRLPNGNTLICEGLESRIFEVTPDKEIVWELTELELTTNTPGTCDGYTLFGTTVEGKDRICLVDMDGEIINSWDMGSMPPKMLPNGSVIGRISEPTVSPPGMTPMTYRAYRVPPEWVPGNPSEYTEWAELYE